MLPMVFMRSGVILGTVMVLVAAAANYWSHFMLTQSAMNVGVKTYPELAEKAGGKALKMVLIWSILSVLFAGLLAVNIVSK